ncbi:LADA_0F08020g1_1 [Lachancea dasiensis]|uniref:LADA_0F08020g1_1 n=1 Tax=Lachancea dasiensis TaxID=1072105 RepID=A0A1G4JL66_9SACH|nr:LADA_0F08020g1_1 [Lachancea dasiensis]
MNANNVEGLLLRIKTGVATLDGTPEVMVAIDHFQQDSSILTAQLGELVETLTGNFFTSSTHDQSIIGSLFYSLSKVCGIKRTMKHMPTDIFLLSKVMALLQRSDQCDQWKLAFMLLAWLKMVLMCPFKLDTDEEIVEFTSQFKASPVLKPLVAGVHSELFSKNAALFRKCHIGGHVDLLTLNHTLKAVLLQNDSKPSCYFVGSSSLAELTKTCLARREDLNDTDAAILLKILPKLCRLHAAQESWEPIEEITSWLLNNLALRSTDLRFQLAHSFAKIIQVLAKVDVDSAISLVEDILSDVTTDIHNTPINALDTNKLHSELLVIAEVARLGVLVSDLIHKFASSILPVTIKFQQLRISTITGHQIRDATNFICWSIVRNCDVTTDFETIFFHLLMCSMFDHEFTIRRSAAAALQESLGRYRGGLLDDASTMMIIELPIHSLQISFQENVPKLFAIFSRASPQLVRPLLRWLIFHNILESNDYKVVELSSASVNKLMQCEVDQQLPEVLLSMVISAFECAGKTTSSNARLVFLTAERPFLHHDLVSNRALSCFHAITLDLNERSNNPDELFKVFAFMKALKVFASDGFTTQKVDADILDTLLRIIRFRSPSDAYFPEIEKMFLPIAAKLLSSEACFVHHTLFNEFTTNFKKLTLFNNPLCCAGMAYMPAAEFLNEFTTVCPRLSCEARCYVIRALLGQSVRIVRSQGLGVLDVIVDLLDDYTITNQGDVGSLVRKCTTDLIQAQFELFMGCSVEMKERTNQKLARIAAEPTNDLREAAFSILTKQYRFEYTPKTNHYEAIFRFYSIYRNELGDALLEGFVFSAGAIYSTDQQMRTSMDCFIKYYNSIQTTDRIELLCSMLRIIPSFRQLQCWQQTTAHVNTLGCQKRDEIKFAIVCVNFWRRAFESGVFPDHDFKIREAFAKFYNLHLIKNTALKVAVVKLMPYIAVTCSNYCSYEWLLVKDEVVRRLKVLADRYKNDTDKATNLRQLAYEGLATVHLAFNEYDSLGDIQQAGSDDECQKPF